MKRKYLLIIGLFIGLICAYIFYINFLSVGPRMAKRSTDVEISANDLMTAFESEEENANGLYLNKILAVSGKIISVDLTKETKPTINLETDGFGVIKCTLESADDFDNESMTIGSNLTIKGECIGYLLDVLINDSIMLND